MYIYTYIYIYLLHIYIYMYVYTLCVRVFACVFIATWAASYQGKV